MLCLLAAALVSAVSAFCLRRAAAAPAAIRAASGLCMGAHAANKARVERRGSSSSGSGWPHAHTTPGRHAAHATHALPAVTCTCMQCAVCIQPTIMPHGHSCSNVKSHNMHAASSMHTYSLCQRCVDFHAAHATEHSIHAATGMHQPMQMPCALPCSSIAPNSMTTSLSTTISGHAAPRRPLYFVR
eukprot:363818-Chlamydomonas_euryale.AAC.4